jgi:hypothetical protein
VTGPASIVGYLASRGIAVEYFAVTNPRDLAVDTGAKLSLTAAHIAARRGGIVVPIAGFQPPTAQQELFVYSGYPIISAELNQLYAAIGRYPEYLAIVGNARSMPMSYSAPNESDGQFHDPPTDFDYANADADPFADIAVGLMACHRRTARLGLLGMVAVTATYLAGATLWRPDLWADPLGPMVKVLPAAMLAVVALALLEER